MNFKGKYLLIVLLTVLFVFLQTNLLAQCAMCKQAAESSVKNNPNSPFRTLNTGILYLMAVPYLMIAFIFRKQIASLWRKMRGKANEN